MMIEPIKFGDELFPFIAAPEGSVDETVWRPDWDDHKQISLDIRTIDYLLQFPEKHGKPGLTSMIDRYYSVGYAKADDFQKARFDEIMAIRRTWTPLNM